MDEGSDSVGPIIVCSDVHKWFGNFEALRGISMEVERGEVVVIFGPSGSGKSTFIRTLNRLEEHQAGEIRESCGQEEPLGAGAGRWYFTRLADHWRHGE